ncbi:ATP-binding protein [Streptomyces sp. NPDC087290]|uniref:ATP-binding protein n=1 Tax=Streptomyces sp. NPDC087290 TaxID=3365776 RepID=UPI0037F8F3B9
MHVPTSAFTSVFAALCPAATAEASPPVPYPHLALRPTPSQAHPRPYLRSKGHSGRGLSLSFTLPGDLRSAFIGRTAVAAALEAHGLTPYVWPVTHAVGELLAVTARMSPGKEIYVSLRHRDDAVRLLVWDQHPHHAEPGLAALCETRRRRALWLLAAVVDDWGGEWGACEANSPQCGTKSWVRLPR